jgi:hypothetical protein
VHQAKALEEEEHKKLSTELMKAFKMNTAALCHQSHWTTRTCKQKNGEDSFPNKPNSLGVLASVNSF